jgi:hypothetical protein
MTGIPTVVCSGRREESVLLGDERPQLACEVLDVPGSGEVARTSSMAGTR